MHDAHTADHPHDHTHEEMKKVDESWKAAADQEKRSAEAAGTPETPEASFTLFVSGLMMECLIALGEIEHPVTKKKEPNLSHARFIIDTITMLKEKTVNNLTADESAMLEAVLYELRMRFLGSSPRQTG